MIGQRARSRIVAAAVLLTAAACCTAAAHGRHVIEYYGDSTIWGYDPLTGRQVAKPAPAAFAEALPANGGYTVRNEGVSGTTACQLLEGNDGRHPTWTAQMAKSDAEFIVIDFAINDEWKYGVERYRSCLLGLAETAARYGKQAIFETPNPTRDSGRDGLDVYVEAMRTVAAQGAIPVIDQYRYLNAYLDGQSPYTICPDGLHPTAAIYLMKGRYAARVFRKLFIKG